MAPGYTHEENLHIQASVAFDTAEQIGMELGRSGASISTQISRLRKEGWHIVSGRKKAQGRGGLQPGTHGGRSGYSDRFPVVPDFVRLTD